MSKTVPKQTIIFLKQKFVSLAALNWGLHAADVQKLVMKMLGYCREDMFRFENEGSAATDN